ncbi:AraC family transcriptional regulator [Aestuariicella hydrocarbonica]|uniref:AraC family transcriptional regulator n=1 Tax=Pseudomaricurvus hydrocarbonicus TaxID=1470433 RepID=A0A9E5JRX9_9GAMM|nr:AraC family transcriptional regulator [Aestuariicella hydrocarbonica]NHO64219.1 AraC family transcriptional regulator [Aestuariicella hydrocarbonica]
MSDPTVIGSWLTLYTAALESYGIDSREFLSARGINAEQASDPRQRLSIRTMNQLVDDAVKETADPCFGLKAGSLVTPNALSALGMVLWSACSIKEQLQRFIRYLHVVGDFSDMEIQESDGVLVSVTTFYPGAGGKSLISDYGQDAVCAVLHTLRRTLYKRDFSPLKMELTRATPENPKAYEAFFGCPVFFEQPRIRIDIRMEDALAPIPGGSAYLAKASERMLDEYLLQLKMNDDIVGQLRQALTVMLPQGNATMDKVSEQLHLSKRTFHRKLDELGTSFREQLEQFRRELAFRYIAEDELTFGDISFLLGFSSSSNFTRAFKRWTGKTPQEYRS